MKAVTWTNNRPLIGELLALGLALSLAITAGHAQVPQQPSSKVTAKTANLVLLPETTGTGEWVTLLSNNIKMPNQKDLFITASFEAGLYTRTQTTDTSSSTARAKAQIRVLLDGQEVEPGPTVYANRVQTLRTEIGATETIEFILDTMAAASFSYVAVDVPVGVHTVAVQARVDTGGNGTFSALGGVGKGTLTVEDVRLIRGEDVVLEMAP